MLNRYLLKEINIIFFAITGIFLLLIVGNKSIDLIKNTNLLVIPAFFLIKLIVLNIPFAISLILPMAYTLAVLFSLIRFNISGEFVVILAGGKSHKSIFLPIFLFGILYTLFGLFLTLYLAPLAQNTSLRLMDFEERKVDFSFITPKLMQNFDGRGIYVTSVNEEKTELYQVLLFENKQNGWEIIKAELAKQIIVQDKYRTLVLEKGTSYKIPNKDLSVEKMDFTSSGKIIGEISQPSEPQVLQALSLKDLLEKNSLSSKAQVQWRLAIPLLLPLLLFVAYSLSIMDKRNSSYKNLFPVLLLILVSIFACFGLERSVAKGDISLFPGVFYIHIILSFISFFLVKHKKIFSKKL